MANLPDQAYENLQVGAFKLVNRLRIKNTTHSRQHLEDLVLEELLLAASTARTATMKDEKARVIKIMQEVISLADRGEVEKIKKLAQDVIKGPEAYQIFESVGPRLSQDSGSGAKDDFGVIHSIAHVHLKRSLIGTCL